MFSRESDTGLTSRLATAHPVRDGGHTLAAAEADLLHRLADEVAEVAESPAADLYEEAMPPSDATGPLLHVALRLDVERERRQLELEALALRFVRLGRSIPSVADISGLTEEWLAEHA